MEILNLIISKLDWLALIIGTIGTILWSHNGKSAKYAAVLWFISSIIWVIYAYLNNLPTLGMRDAISISLYIYGMIKWMKPKDVKTE